jgi:hypothetical protein
MRAKIRKTANVLWQRKTQFVLNFGLIAALYSFFTGIVNVGFWPPQFLGLTFSLFSALALFLVSLLSAILITLQIYRFQISNIKFQKENSVGLIGMASSFFVSACPFCKPLLLSVFGLGGATSIIAKYGFQVTIVSLTLLLISIILVANTITNECKNCKN